MKQQPMRPTLPTFGEVVPGEGGRLGAIMRGPMVGGVRQPDYAIIVPDIAGKKLAWGKRRFDIAGAMSLTDGQANTGAMLASKCPPALHISKLKTAEGHADLYLPARAELQALYANVPELFDKAWHWSSTQDGSSLAFDQSFDDGWSGWSNKDDELLVRPVRRIPLQHFPT